MPAAEDVEGLPVGSPTWVMAVGAGVASRAGAGTGAGVPMGAGVVGVTTGVGGEGPGVTEAGPSHPQSTPKVVGVAKSPEPSGKEPIVPHSVVVWRSIA